MSIEGIQSDLAFPLGRMEATPMIVRLHNLSARSPGMADLEAITALIRLCDLNESGISDYREEDMQHAWQTQDFNLKTDAWVIVTNKGQLVGYADVRQNESTQFLALIRVHPDYRGRGIGTLLIWLTEKRARQLTRRVPPGRRVTLNSTVNNLNQGARELLEREGYRPVRTFLRLVIDMESVPASKEAYQQGKIRIDLVVDAQHAAGAAQLREHDGLYVACLYDVYEKELRAGVELCPNQAFSPQPIAV